MKHSLMTALLWVTTIVVLTSCGVTNNSFTARSRYIEGGRIKEQPKAAEIDVDFSLRVTAQSDWQPSKSAARTEAGHNGRQQQCDGQQLRRDTRTCHCGPAYNHHHAACCQ